MAALSPEVEATFVTNADHSVQQPQIYLSNCSGNASYSLLDGPSMYSQELYTFQWIFEGFPASIVLLEVVSNISRRKYYRRNEATGKQSSQARRIYEHELLTLHC